MTSCNSASEIERVIQLMSDPMKKALIVSFYNQDEGFDFGTWIKLVEMGLLDKSFQISKLGIEVANAIR